HLLEAISWRGIATAYAGAKIGGLVGGLPGAAVGAAVGGALGSVKGETGKSPLGGDIPSAGEVLGSKNAPRSTIQSGGEQPASAAPAPVPSSPGQAVPSAPSG